MKARCPSNCRAATTLHSACAARWRRWRGGRTPPTALRAFIAPFKLGIGQLSRAGCDCLLPNPLLTAANGCGPSSPLQGGGVEKSPCDFSLAVGAANCTPSGDFVTARLGGGSATAYTPSASGRPATYHLPPARGRFRSFGACGTPNCPLSGGNGTVAGRAKGGQPLTPPVAEEAARDAAGLLHGDKRLRVDVVGDLYHLSYVLTPRDHVDQADRTGNALARGACRAETRLAYSLDNGQRAGHRDDIDRRVALPELFLNE